MTRRSISMMAAGLLAFLLAACGEPEVAEAPPPMEPTRDAMGYYCSMTVVDHPGPKGQIHLDGEAQPLWFSSVRDTIAFTLLPEERKDITAVYVNDMARAKTWDQPEAETWIIADEAWYVIGSSRRGGMGAPEAVPFGIKTAAAEFATAHGGHVVSFKDIPRVAILGNPNDSSSQQAKGDATDAHSAHRHSGRAAGQNQGHSNKHDVPGGEAMKHGEHKH